MKKEKKIKKIERKIEEGSDKVQKIGNFIGYKKDHGNFSVISTVKELWRLKGDMVNSNLLFSSCDEHHL